MLAHFNEVWSVVLLGAPNRIKVDNVPALVKKILSEEDPGIASQIADILNPDHEDGEIGRVYSGRAEDVVREVDEIRRQYDIDGYDMTHRDKGLFVDSVLSQYIKSKSQLRQIKRTIWLHEAGRKLNRRKPMPGDLDLEENKELREEIERQERETGIHTIRPAKTSVLARTVDRVTRGISRKLLERDRTGSGASATVM